MHYYYLEGQRRYVILFFLVYLKKIKIKMERPCLTVLHGVILVGQTQGRAHGRLSNHEELLSDSVLPECREMDGALIGSLWG